MVLRKKICETPNLSELYKFVLNEILQTDFNIPDYIVYDIHTELLDEIKQKCQPLVHEGLLPANSLSHRLDYEVDPILNEALELKSNKRFSFNQNKYQSLYHGIGEKFTNFDILSGSDNTAVLQDMEEWLGDNGNLNCQGQEGRCEELEESFSQIQDQLTVDEILPTILKSYTGITTKTIKCMGDGVTTGKASCKPIIIQFLAHEPDDVQWVENINLYRKNMKFNINESGIYIEDNFNISLEVPFCADEEVEVQVNAEIRFELCKQYKVSMLANVFTLGLYGSAYSSDETRKEFHHELSLRVRMNSRNLKLRERVEIKVSPRKANEFMESINAIQQIREILQEKGVIPAISESSKKLPTNEGNIHGLAALKYTADKDIHIELDKNNTATITTTNTENLNCGMKSNFEMTEECVASMDILLNDQDNIEMVKNMFSGTKVNTVKRLTVDIEDLNKSIKIEVKKVQMLEKKYKSKFSAKGNQNSHDPRRIRQDNRIQKQIQKIKVDIEKSKSVIAKKEYELKITKKEVRSYVEKNINNKYLKTAMCKRAFSQAAQATIQAAAVTAISTLICTGGDEFMKWQKGEITFKEMALTVMKETGKATLTGGLNGLSMAAPTLASEVAAAYSIPGAGILSTAAKFTGPAITGALLVRQANSVLSDWKRHDITSTDLKKFAARTCTNITLNYAAVVDTASFIGGPFGLLAGLGLVICIGTADHFLGDNILNCFFKQDESEAIQLLERRFNKMKEDVLKKAYELLDLTESCTRQELKEKRKAAILKYHPDKDGDRDIFEAVEAAYRFICCERSFDEESSQKIMKMKKN